MVGRHTKQFNKRKKIIFPWKITQWSLFIIQMRRFGMCAPWFHAFDFFFHFLLFRPPSYLHKLQSSAWNHEEIGKFTWKYIELFVLKTYKRKESLRLNLMDVSPFVQIGEGSKHSSTSNTPTTYSSFYKVAQAQLGDVLDICKVHELCCGVHNTHPIPH